MRLRTEPCAFDPDLQSKATGSMRGTHGAGSTALAADGNVGNTRAAVTYERDARGTSVRGDVTTQHGDDAAAASVVHEGGRTHLHGEVSHKGQARRAQPRRRRHPAGS